MVFISVHRQAVDIPVSIFILFQVLRTKCWNWGEPTWSIMPWIHRKATNCVSTSTGTWRAKLEWWWVFGLILYVQKDKFSPKGKCFHVMIPALTGFKTAWFYVLKKANIPLSQISWNIQCCLTCFLSLWRLKSSDADEAAAPMVTSVKLQPLQANMKEKVSLRIENVTQLS